MVRSPKERFVSSAYKAAMAIMKSKDMINTTKAAESSDLSLMAVTDQEALLQGLNAICCDHNKAFQNLLKSQELKSSKNLAESAGLFQFNLAYKVRR